MIPFAKVNVLVAGYHRKEKDRLKISSTVTLIQSDKIIVVDAGGFGQENSIRQELAKHGLTPEQVEIVFLTHLHLDHIVNVQMFPNAVVYGKFIGGEYPGQRHFPKEGTLERMELRDGTAIADGVTVIELPGHTSDMLGIVVETDQGKILVAGDSIPSEKNMDMEKKPPDMMLWNSDEFDKSRQKVMNLVDYIIPGHGERFKVQK